MADTTQTSAALLLGLFLVACSPVATVDVTFFDGWETKDVCTLRSDVIDPDTMKPVPMEIQGEATLVPSNAVIRVKLNSGSLDVGMLASENCLKREKVQRKVTHDETLTAEEFNFRYENDAAFKKSVIEYHFSRPTDNSQ